MIGITTVCNYFDVPAIRLPSQYDEALIRVRIKSIETGRSLETRLDLLKMSADGKAYVAVDGDVMHIGEAVAWEVTLAVSGQDLQDWFHSADEVPLSEWPMDAHARAHGPAPEGACAGARVDVGADDAQERPTEPSEPSEDAEDVPEAEEPAEARTAPFHVSPEELERTDVCEDPEQEEVPEGEQPSGEAPKPSKYPRPSKTEILDLLRFHTRPMTVKEMICIFNLDFNEPLRTYMGKTMAALEEEGKVRRAGSERTHGKPAVMWEVVA